MFHIHQQNTTKKKPYVIMVDDSEIDADLARRSIMSSEYDIDMMWFDEGESALEFLKVAKEIDHLPRIMILDLKMPCMDGFEVLEFLNRTNMKNFPIVVMSGSGLSEDKRKVQMLKADGFFEKPYDLHQSQKIIWRILSHFLSKKPGITLKDQVSV